jgi:hypothetical protein
MNRKLELLELEDGAMELLRRGDSTGSSAASNQGEAPLLEVAHNPDVRRFEGLSSCCAR